MPKAKIIKAFVDQVPHTERGQIAYCDTDLPGFYLIVGSQTKTYAAQKDMQGKAIRCTIGRHGHFTPEQARKIAKEKLYLMSIGIDPNKQEKEAQAKTVTLDEVLEAYLAARTNLKPRTREDYRYYIDKYLGDWRDKRMTEITKDMIGPRHAKIAETSGRTSANKAMRLLRAMFNFSIAAYDICPANPVVYLTHTKGWFKENRRRSYIKPHDLKNWWEGVHALENDTYRDFLLMLLFTGLRRSEAAGLRWSDIDFKDRTFTIQDTKNGDPLTLPLSVFLHDLLEQRRKHYGNYVHVFPGPGKQGYLSEPKKGVYKVIEHSGVDFTCHDLRRTFITIGEGLDLSGYALKRLINHRVTDVTGGYIIVDVERLREPVEKIANFIQRHVGDTVQRSGRNFEMRD
ncbi:MAG: DUF4102 domain-containing protein [Alphaproteobacteria bacterium PRO2]|nr:DUF4102 domain-containing protein [Alphaproteobacteria bacterium PRO2]